MTLVIDPDFTSENQKKLFAKIKKIITDLKGDVAKTTEWGKKEFSYPIKKKNQGEYFLWELRLPEESTLDLEKKMKLEEEIIRYLLIKVEKPHSVKAKRGKGGKNGAKVAK